MARPVDDNQDHTLEEALQQFVNLQLRGQEPDLEELVRHYPEHEHAIRNRMGKLRKINSLFDSLVQADESDFEDAVAGHDLIGQKIGSFEITEMIGRGGMGVVYLAHDTKLERSVAIKSMPANLADESTARTRFRREARLLASLNHPNVAVIYEIIEQAEGAGYLILEYVPGQTLAERITEGPLRLDEALTIAFQIAEAMAAAHEHGVIHRDLKPGNIKITPEGRVKVLDFGLAKAPVSEDKAGDITATQAGRVVGTPAYMSPEQARGKDADQRTDIWSFGCIMYQMLTGRLPFEGETATDTLAQIIEREPDWGVLPQTTPASIRDLLRRCLEKDAERRPGDIADAVAEINEALSLPATALPMTIGARLRTIAMIGAAAVIVLASGVAVSYKLTKRVPSSAKQIRLVVLPFANLGPGEDEYFADGVTDAITTRLAGIHGLRVISRQSAMQYKNSEKSARQIAEELGVDYILEGTVQRERPGDTKSRVTIRPQLIRASDDTHVWAQPYDDEMSEVSQVQSDVAEQVAEALDIALLEPERRALESRPIENVEAYDYYLQGNQYYHRALLPAYLGRAIRMYDKAVELDPNLALAHAQLSRAHLLMYWLHYDRNEERLIRARRAVEKVLQLDPELPEAHLALGHYCYQAELDYDRAVEQFEIALKSRPNDGEIIFSIGCVQRRQGKFEQAVANMKKASELDPRRGLPVTNLAETLVLMRRYGEAERCLDRAIPLLQYPEGQYCVKGFLYMQWQGSIDKARAVLQEALESGVSADDDNIVNLAVYIDVFDGNYQEAFDRRLASRGEGYETQHYFIPKALECAQICTYMKKEGLAKQYFEDARIILESKVEERWEDARVHSSLGIAYAGLGRKEEAIREGELAVDLLHVNKDAMKGPHRIADLARIYAMVGEYELAIRRLEYLLSIPSRLSIPLLGLDPAWDPLRDHPRFKKLVEAGK